MNVYKGVIYENICTKPENVVRRESIRSLCPISEVQFVRAVQPASVVQEHVRALLDGVIVVGFAFHNDLSVLGVTLFPDIVRDVQKSYTPQQCAELGMRGLPTRQPGQVYALKDLVFSAFGQVIQEGPHSAVKDANATMRLYFGTHRGTGMLYVL